MADEEIDIVYNSGQNRRVVIFRRPSGTYGYREERHYKNEVAEGWASLGGRACHYADLQTAKREVVENVTWLRQQI
jgi:phosphoribosylformimino-5-aminoimidazole carboxamide ribonucleotide (ProFAR) isomerase